MNWRSTVSRFAGFLRREAGFFVAVASLLLITFQGDALMGGLAASVAAGLLFAWIFPVMLWSVFGVVRHAETLMRMVGEPYGTLVLTFAVVSVEVSLIASIMLTGEESPTLARDAMFAILMIVMNGLVGAALLVGGLIHREQSYSLNGARSFLSVLIPLAVFALVLPYFTVSTDAPTFSRGQAAFFAIITAMLYAVFLAVQTVRHQGFFSLGDKIGAPAHAAEHPRRKMITCVVMIVLTLAPIVLLSKRLAESVDYGVATLGAPVALGGIIVALLVLAPEGLTALRAARANQLQRSINLLLGAALSTIGLTVPAVLLLSLQSGRAVVLGLDEVSMVLLSLTFVLSMITFSGAQTNVLQGAVHLVVFFAYVALVLSP